MALRRLVWKNSHTADADSEGAHPASAPVHSFKLYALQKIVCAPGSCRYFIMLAPPGSIFSGSAPGHIGLCCRAALQVPVPLKMNVEFHTFLLKHKMTIPSIV